MLRISLALLLVALFSIAIYAQKGPDPGWKDILSADLFLYQYSSTQITSTPQGTIKFLVKISPTVEGILDAKARDAVISIRQQNNQPIKGYAKWAYAVVEYEANCSQQKYRSLSWTDYKRSGGALGTETPAGDWRDAVPDSIAEAMLKKACNSK
jgi:hypothetical protein